MKKITFLLFLITSIVYGQTPEGTWKISPVAGSLGVGPNQGDTSWWAIDGAGVTARACFYDDEYVFNSDGSFSNVLGTDTWVEGWQGGPDACASPVAPHDSSNAATWAYDSGANTITLTGIGAYLGIPKAVNGSELSTPSAAPASVTYIVTSISDSEMTIDIQSGAAWWRFLMTKNGVATCNDGIQNGDETGIDCGGSCSTVCAVAPTTAAPTPPSRNDWDVFSVYSDAYTDITIDNFDAGWCGGNTVTEVMIASNNTQHYSGGNACQGIDFSSNKIDATGFTHLHFDFYTDATDLTGKVFNVKLVDFGGGTAEASAFEVNFNTGTSPAMVTGSWVSVDVAIDGSFDMSDIAQIGITSNLANAWYDNLYIYRAATASVDANNLSNISSYPNPVRNTLNISADNTIENITIYNVLGKKIKDITINKNADNIDVSSLNTGVYILKYIVNNAVGTMKFVKE